MNEEITQQQIDSYLRNVEYRKRYNAEYRKRNPEKVKMWMKKSQEKQKMIKQLCRERGLL